MSELADSLEGLELTIEGNGFSDSVAPTSVKVNLLRPLMIRRIR